MVDDDIWGEKKPNHDIRFLRSTWKRQQLKAKVIFEKRLQAHGPENDKNYDLRYFLQTFWACNRQMKH